MRRRNSTSRARQRQQLLRELAAEEIYGVTSGNGHSRAAEAIEALQKIRNGTYGICVDCGKRIPAARLQVKPEATRCVICQSEYEERRDLAVEWNNVAKKSA